GPVWCRHAGLLGSRCLYCTSSGVPLGWIRRWAMDDGRWMIRLVSKSLIIRETIDHGRIRECPGDLRRGSIIWLSVTNGILRVKRAIFVTSPASHGRDYTHHDIS